MQNKFDFSHLSPDERLSLIGELWDSLSPENIPVTDEQKKELESRLEAMESGQLKTYSWEEVKKHLKLDE